MTMTMVTGSQCLIPRDVAGVVGLVPVLQDDVHHPKTSSVVHGSRGIPGMEDIPRSSRTLYMNLTRVTSWPALMMQSAFVS
jgi:hypothetical protein